jgi:6,7-dimethyl-8-ribityllumazine synthase
MAKVVEHEVDAQGVTLAIVVARFNEDYTGAMLEGALDKIRKSGGDADNTTVVWVPGAFELALASQAYAKSGEYDAVVALGVVIRGQTPHFDYVCQAAADGILRASLDTGVPIAFGVLTCSTAQQARLRCQSGPDNKGCEATEAAIQMVHVLRGVE